ncbi:MAG TPA: hypothetical protein PLR44_12495 [Thermomicrobiales bacterium]|nr:hypothetical protein [Chloroflexota bacterium]HBY46968.1 hypothetical protein [Chloroflexota bacterium]HCG28771.1 hypothetical protein [Chloroflexota bacterium]HQZ90862.1 hypothetical protein [Thermomicrobiales bacterium]HRA32213.1 hypothetical protein [Thermomicrobiales bacterium]
MLPGDLWIWLLVAALAALCNVTPVLAPPTWGVLAWFSVHYNLPILPVAIVGAVGSTFGRIILALASRWLGERIIPARQRADAQRYAEMIRQNTKLNLPALAMFAFGPIPKAMLFMAAGIARIPLLPGAVVYGVARAGIYFGALLAAETTVTSFGDLFSLSGAGSLIIATQVASTIGVFLLFRMDIPKLVERIQRWRGVEPTGELRWSPVALVRRALPARTQVETQ